MHCWIKSVFFRENWLNVEPCLYFFVVVMRVSNRKGGTGLHPVILTMYPNVVEDAKFSNNKITPPYQHHLFGTSHSIADWKEKKTQS